jgi:hypothetical protein
MDYFEATIARILEEQGYWVRQGVRVALSNETRKRLGKPSSSMRSRYRRLPALEALAGSH